MRICSALTWVGSPGTTVTRTTCKRSRRSAGSSSATLADADADADADAAGAGAGAAALSAGAAAELAPASMRGTELRCTVTCASK